MQGIQLVVSVSRVQLIKLFTKSDCECTADLRRADSEIITWQKISFRRVETPAFSSSKQCCPRRSVQGSDLPVVASSLACHSEQQTGWSDVLVNSLQ